LKICILGAGISGTTLARLLAADGHTVVVLEKYSRAGGLCRSRVTDGFTWDEAGGHIIFSKNKAALAWQQERAGGMAALCEIQRQTRILWHDRFVPYPFENGVGHLTKEAIVDCIEGYVEAYVRRKGGEACPANFKDWILWRMGDGFARHFMVPYNQKIWDCDLASMSSAWVAGRVPEAPLRDVISSAVGLDTEGYAHQSVFWFPEHGGFETLVHGTVRGGGFTLRTGTAAQRVQKVGSRFSVDGEDFDLVVNTVPLPQIAPTIADIPEAIRADIRELKPISLLNVIIGVKVDQPIPAHSWIYLPFPDQGDAGTRVFHGRGHPPRRRAGRPRVRRPARRSPQPLRVVRARPGGADRLDAERVRLHRPAARLPGAHRPGAPVVRHFGLHHLRSVRALRVPQQRPVHRPRDGGAPAHRCHRQVGRAGAADVRLRRSATVVLGVGRVGPSPGTWRRRAKPHT
jgi:protoporphyrinogen oxidase